MVEKKLTVKRMTVTKSPEVLASETLLAVVMSNTVQEAADKLGITRQMVHERIKRYELKDKIAELRNHALLDLQMGASKAAQKLVRLVESENEAVARAASDSVLDRVGLTKADSSEQKGNTFNFNFKGNANFSVEKYKE